MIIRIVEDHKALFLISTIATNAEDCFLTCYTMSDDLITISWPVIVWDLVNGLARDIGRVLATRGVILSKLAKGNDMLEILTPHLLVDGIRVVASQYDLRN